MITTLSVPLVGVVLALAFGVGASMTGLERKRLLYPATLVVIAATYDLFAITGGSRQVLGIETLVLGFFAGAAFIGFRITPWALVAGLALHGVLNLIHPHIVTNPGVPAWWPEFCSSYDITAAAYVAWRLIRRRRCARFSSAILSPK